MFGLSKDTVHRCIKRGIITGINPGSRLTRVKRSDLENLFSSVEIPEEKEVIMRNTILKLVIVYTISEISSKFHADPGTVTNLIKRKQNSYKESWKFCVCS